MIEAERNTRRAAQAHTSATASWAQPAATKTDAAVSGGSLENGTQTRKAPVAANTTAATARDTAEMSAKPRIVMGRDGFEPSTDGL